MENKKLYIGLGILAIAGIGYYMWKKNKSENKSSASGCDCGCGCCDEKENVSNLTSNDDKSGFRSCINHYMKEGLTQEQATAKCQSGRVVKKPKFNEIKSNVQSSGEPTKRPILNPTSDCISKWLMQGASLEDAQLMCSDLSRAIKSATNPYIKKDIR